MTGPGTGLAPPLLPDTGHAPSAAHEPDPRPSAGPGATHPAVLAPALRAIVCSSQGEGARSKDWTSVKRRAATSVGDLALMLGPCPRLGQPQQELPLARWLQDVVPAVLTVRVARRHQ